MSFMRYCSQANEGGSVMALNMLAGKIDQPGDIQRLVSSCWLTDLYDPYDELCNHLWGREFQRLFRALHWFTDDADDLRCDLEEQALGEMTLISPRQAARFWFLIGTYHADHQRYHDAFEALFVCERHLPATDKEAAIIVYTALADAAEHVFLPATAHLYYSLALTMLSRDDWHEAAPWTKKTRLALADHILDRRSQLASSAVLPPA
jgi:hypothetical protein